MIKYNYVPRHTSVLAGYRQAERAFLWTAEHRAVIPDVIVEVKEPVINEDVPHAPDVVGVTHLELGREAGQPADL